MKDNSACFSSNSVHWATPRKLYNAFMDHGFLDPCPLHATFDGLNIDYYNKKLYINPPFKDMDKWVDFALRQFNNGCEIMFLMPSRTDTKYFHKLCDLAPTIYFLKGRLKFNDSDKAAPFPCVIISIKQRIFKDLWFNCSVDEFICSYL